MSKNGLEMSSKDGIVNCMSPKKHGCFTIAIEGNIGSGKSTMINYFKRFEEVQVHAGMVTNTVWSFVFLQLFLKNPIFALKTFCCCMR